MRGNSSHGNREVQRAPDTDGVSGRPEKASGRTSGMHARGKSDGRIVPEKPTNNGERLSPAEPVEGRRPTEGNVSQSAAHRTQCRARASIGLRRVREVARRDGRARFPGDDAPGPECPPLLRGDVIEVFFCFLFTTALI